MAHRIVANHLAHATWRCGTIIARVLGKIVITVATIAQKVFQALLFCFYHVVMFGVRMIKRLERPEDPAIRQAVDELCQRVDQSSQSIDHPCWSDSTITRRLHSFLIALAGERLTDSMCEDLIKSAVESNVDYGDFRLLLQHPTIRLWIRKQPADKIGMMFSRGSSKELHRIMSIELSQISSLQGLCLGVLLDKRIHIPQEANLAVTGALAKDLCRVPKSWDGTISQILRRRRD